MENSPIKDIIIIRFCRNLTEKVNLLGGTETSRRELANATRDQDGVLYNIEELREIWEFIAQVFSCRS